MKHSASQRLVSLSYTSNGDLEKKNRRTLLSLRVIHSLCLASLALAVLAPTVVLPSMGFVPYSGGIGDVVAMFYVGCLSMSVLGYKWNTVSRSFRYITHLFAVGIGHDTAQMELAVSHILRIFLCFEISVLSGFVLGILGASWYLAIPLFLLAGTALILTYPTDARWVRWQRDHGPAWQHE